MRLAIGGRALLAATLFLVAIGTAVSAPPRLAHCDALVAREPDAYESYQCYWYLARSTGQWNEVTARLEALVAARPGDPKPLLYLAAVAADSGDPRAKGYYRRAAEGFVEEDDVQGEVWARTSLAIILRTGGSASEARQQLEQALARAEEKGATPLELEVLVQLGWQGYYERDYGAARSRFVRAARKVFPDGPLKQRLAVLDGQAALAWALGRFEDAIETYRAELALLGEGDPFRRAGVRRNIALVGVELVREGRIERETLIGWQREALAASVAVGNPRASIAPRLLLGETLGGEAGFAQIERALADAKRVQVLSDHCWALRLSARVGLESGILSWEQALGRVNEALELARSHGDREGTAAAFVSRSHLFWRHRPRAEALAASLAALDAVEDLRDRQPGDTVRARVFSRYAEDYRRFVLQTLGAEDSVPDETDAATALAIVERLRARTLLDTLDAAGVTAALAPEGPLAEQRNVVLGKIAAVQKKLMRPGLDEEARSRELVELAALEAEESALRDTLARQNLVFAALHRTRFASVAEVQSALAEDQAMVVFVASEGHGSRALLIARDRLRVAALPSGRRLARAIDVFLGLLERRDTSASRGARRLFSEILEPVVAELPAGTRRLILLPDGPLHRVPFAALEDPRTGQRCGESYEISLAPSATIWLRWRRQAHAALPRPLLAFADPVTGPVVTPAGERDGSSVLAGAELGRLPHARDEATRLARRLGGESRVLTGEEASEAALKRAPLGEYALLHFATHALLDREAPERSAILLATGGAGDDGLLQLREIAELELDGQTVLLSACRSGAGPVLGGEGVQGLAGAFFLAGARSAVAALWPLRDDEAERLVDAFGRELSRGKSVAGALRAARCELAADGEPVAAWAGMVVLGDGDHVPFPNRGGGMEWGWYVAIGAVLAGALGVLVLRRMRRV